MMKNYCGVLSLFLCPFQTFGLTMRILRLNNLGSSRIRCMLSKEIIYRRNSKRRFWQSRYHAVRMSLNLSSDEEDLDEFIIPKSDEYLGSNVGKIIQANIDRAEKIIRFKAEGADVQYSEDNTAADEDDFVDSLDGSIDLNALTKNLLQKFNSVQRREGSSKDSNRRSGLTRISTQLMESSINSAKRTLTTRDEFLQGNKTNETSGNETPLLNSTPENTSIFKDVPRSSEKGSAKKGSESATKEASPYLSNPSITVTALSHSLWSSALDIDDCAIDATCGKGKDSAELADIMFSKPRHEGMYLKKELVCVDIQEQAVSCTEALIRDQIGNETFQKYVRVVQKSHFPLPEPQHNRKVGLICYNLGWLPGSSKKISTSMETTIKSLVDATRLVRVGGLITVVTYQFRLPRDPSLKGNVQTE